MRTINTFKNSNRTNSVTANTAAITNIKFVNGRLTAEVSTPLATAKKLSGFDHSFRIVGANFVASWGKAGHTLSLYKGTSAASHLIGAINATASITKAAITSFTPTQIDADDYITILVAGASWATGTGYVKGLLELETEPC